MFVFVSSSDSSCKRLCRISHVTFAVLECGRCKGGKPPLYWTFVLPECLPLSFVSRAVLNVPDPHCTSSVQLVRYLPPYRKHNSHSVTSTPITRCPHRLAVGSFIEEYNNKVMVVQLDEDAGEFSARSTFEHPYPTTKIMWIPDGVSGS